MEEQFIQELRGLCDQTGIVLSRGQEDKMYAYYKLIAEENEKYNLTSVTSPEAAAKMHFFDSILPCHILPADCSLLDVGSGAGFPAVPIRIARRDVSVTVLDATEKKCRFIEKACEAIGVQVRVVCGRAEELAKGELRESFDVVCARAVAALPVLMELTGAFARKGGLLLYYKADYHQELVAAQGAAKKLSLSLEKTIDAPGTGLNHFVLVFRKENATSATFPRRYAQIKKKPL